MSISLAPGQGAEIKLEMLKGRKVNYFWTANGGLVNYDTHGDPYDAPREFYHGYGKGAPRRRIRRPGGRLRRQARLVLAQPHQQAAHRHAAYRGRLHCHQAGDLMVQREQ